MPAQYDDVANAYARLIAPKYVPIAQLIADRAPTLDGGIVVEPGIGTGLLTQLAAPKLASCAAYVGIDVAAGMLRIARTVVPPWVSLVQSRGEATPLPDACVSLLLSSLGPVQETAEGLAEAARVIRAGGRLLTASWGEGYTELEVLQRARTRVAAGDYPTGVADELERRVKTAGFVDVSLEEVRLDVVHNSVDDYVAYRAGFGRMSWLPEGSYAQWLAYIRDETSPYVDSSGRVHLDWTILVLRATAG